MSLVRELRVSKGWSQEQLAELSGVSGRTIQRLESGDNAALETAKALAAAFEVDHVIFLSPQTDQAAPEDILKEVEVRRRARKRVRARFGFYRHAAIYLFVVGLLAIINLLTNPSYLWFLWTAMGWGIGVAAHGISVKLALSGRGRQWMDRAIEQEIDNEFKS